MTPTAMVRYSAGPWLGLAAPGENITSVSNNPDGGLANGQPNDKGELAPVSGTSYAAAYVSGVAALFTYFVISEFVGWLLIGLTIWVAAFFRDPIRMTPQGEGLVVAPADGLITMIERVPRNQPLQTLPSVRPPVNLPPAMPRHLTKRMPTSTQMIRKTMQRVPTTIRATDLSVLRLVGP